MHAAEGGRYADQWQPVKNSDSAMTSSIAPPVPLQTAVLFLVFNRPDTTAQVFEAIRQAKPPRLYVAADGPREAKDGEAERVARVREIATAVDWPCEVKTLFREKNLGCGYAVKTAIDWFFSNEDMGIILEDDTLPSQSFFWFCQEMLRKFESNQSIMCVTGTNITQGLFFSGGYFFSRYALMWGWASWRRAWSHYDFALEDWQALKRRNWLSSLGLGGLPFRRKWEYIFDLTQRKSLDPTWWGYQWIYTCWLSNGLTVAPAKNLIRNIGYTDDATHTTGHHPILSNLQLNDLDWPFGEPADCAPNVKADAFISKHWFGVGWKSLVKDVMLRLPVVAEVNRVRKNFQKRMRLLSDVAK